MCRYFQKQPCNFWCHMQSNATNRQSHWALRLITSAVALSAVGVAGRPLQEKYDHTMRHDSGDALTSMFYPHSKQTNPKASPKAPLLTHYHSAFKQNARSVRELEAMAEDLSADAYVRSLSNPDLTTK
jgi:hypothetical protein